MWGYSCKHGTVCNLGSQESRWEIKNEKMKILGRILQQDLTSLYTLNVTATYLRNRRIHILQPWPLNSPIGHTIENPWAILKRKVMNRKPNNGRELISITYEEFSDIDSELVKRICFSIPGILQQVHQSSGKCSDYSLCCVICA